MSQYKIDVYKLDFEINNKIVDIEISNFISWDSIKVRLTKEELKGLIDFASNLLDQPC